MKKLVLTITSILLTGCLSGKSTDDAKPVTTIGDEYLTILMNEATSAYGIPYIKIGYGDLNPTQKDYIILGSFFWRNDKTVNIVIDNQLKEKDYHVIYYGYDVAINDDKLKAAVVGHEVCHWWQYVNGIPFNEGNLPHDDRSYEKQCNQEGIDFMNKMIEKGIVK